MQKPDGEKTSCALLSRANSELQDASAELARFARAAAHDLKSPLRVPGALPDRIEEDAPDLSDTVRDYLGEMGRHTGRLEQLNDNLLRYSALGGDGSLPRHLDPGPVIRTLVRALDLSRSFVLDLDVRVNRILTVRSTATGRLAPPA